MSRGRRTSAGEGIAWGLILSLLFWLALSMTGGGGLWAAGGEPAAPKEDFGRYLATHENDLAPFFSQYGGVMVGEAVPLVLKWLGGIMFLALLVGWMLDAALSYGFAVLFAPGLVKIKWSLIYATGRLLLSLALTLCLGMGVMFFSRSAALGTVLVVLFTAGALLGLAAHVGWIFYLYRTDLLISFLFYLTLVVVHGFTTLGISVPMMGAQASVPAKSFMDDSVAPQVEREAESTQAQVAAIAPEREAAAARATHLQDQLAQAKDEEAELLKQIERAKTSETYLYSQIVKVHAEGDLSEARDQFKAFLARFPNGALTGLAKGQLIQIESELAAQDTKKKQDTAAAEHATAQARADLLARAAQGEVTLSEMRRALIGKSRAEVGALLGAPTETASNRWGFAQQMILNPLTNEKSGLAIYFSEGMVQGVDYYYGHGGGP